MIGIEIQAQGSRSQCRGIVKSKNPSPAASFVFCWMARLILPAVTAECRQSNAIHQTRDHDDLVSPSPHCGLVLHRLAAASCG